MPLIRAAVLEDEANSRGQTLEYLKQYGQEKGVLIQVHEYTDGLDLTEDFRNQFDIIFCDIQMKHMDGMRTPNTSVREMSVSLSFLLRIFRNMRSVVMMWRLLDIS